MASAASSPLLVRAPLGAVAERGGEMLLVGADQSVRQLSGASAELARAVLSFLVSPHSRAELAAHLERLSGSALEHPKVVEDLLKLLLSAGVLRDATAPVRDEGPARPTTPRARLVLGLTGAIRNRPRAGDHRPLLSSGFDVEIAATRTALRMVSRLALEALTHRRVHASLHGHDPSMPVPHIHLAEWAEAVLIYPATATTISRIAHGDCSDVVAALAIATRAPVLVVPAMNPATCRLPPSQRNLGPAAPGRPLGRRSGDGTGGRSGSLGPPLALGRRALPAAVLPVLNALLALGRERPASG